MRYDEKLSGITKYQCQISKQEKICALEIKYQKS